MERWKKAVQRSRAWLIQNVDIKDSALLEHVMSEGIISNLQADTIKCTHGPNHKMVSAFIDLLLKRPEADYIKFLKVLRECEHEHVADQLDQALANVAVTTTSSAYRTTQHAPSYQGGGTRGMMDAQPERVNEFATGLEHIRLDVHPPAPKAEIVKLRSELRSVAPRIQPVPISQSQYINTCKQNECYPMKSEARGRALVITMTGNRKGWSHDVIALEEMFRYLNVNAEHKFDLSLEAMRTELRNFAAHEENVDVDVLFVVLMGHGSKWNGQEFLRPADGKPFVVREELGRIFDNDHHPALRDKPKVFIIQMCRGASTAGLELEQRMETDALEFKVQRKVTHFSDYVFGYATQPGHAAHRDTISGTWYIQTLSKVFIEEAHLRPVSLLLSKVNNILEEHAKDKDGGAQLGEAVLGLKCALNLFPGYTPSKP